MNWPTPQHIKPSDDADWPRWVVPHESHIVRRKFEGDPPAPSVQPSNMIWSPGDQIIATAPEHVVVPGFEHSIDRVTGEVTVLVHNEGDERRALEPSAEVKAVERERLAAQEAEERERAEQAEIERLERQAAEDRKRIEAEQAEEANPVGEEAHHD